MRCDHIVILQSVLIERYQNLHCKQNKHCHVITESHLDLHLSISTALNRIYSRSSPGSEQERLTFSLRQTAIALLQDLRQELNSSATGLRLGAGQTQPAWRTQHSFTAPAGFVLCVCLEVCYPTRLGFGFIAKPKLYAEASLLS